MVAESLEVLENLQGTIIRHAAAVDFQDTLARAEPSSHSLRAWGQEHLRPEPGRGARVQLPLPTAASRAGLLPAANQRAAADIAEAAGPMWYLRPLSFGALHARKATD